MADPWAEFRSAPQAPAAGDPWAEFRDKSEKPMSVGEKAADAYKGLGTGAIKGTLALGGMVGDLTDLGAKGIEKASNFVSDKLGVDRYQRPEKPSVLNAIPTTESLTNRLKEALGTDFYHPKSDYGKAAERVGEFVPAAAATAASGGGSLGANVARYALAPGAATFAAEKYLPENEYKPYLTAAAGVGASLVNPARAITPLPASPARQAAVNTLEREGVTSLTAGQRTGNEALRYLEDAASSAPGAGHGAATIQAQGRHQFTEAAARRAGAGPDASPEVLAANQQRLSQGYTDIAARNAVTPDNQMVTDIVNAATRYRFVPNSQQHAIVQGYIDDIVPHINNGTIPGERYQALRSFLNEDAASASDGYLKNALRGIRNALDDAMARSVSPEDAAAWRNLNREYSAQKVLEKAASKAGQETVEGQIAPANLRNTIAAEDRSGYSRGRGQFNELARAGVQVMTPLPNSGTAQRTNAFHLLNAGLLGVPQALAGRAVMSRPVQSYLANQLMTGGAMPTNPTAQQLLLIEALQRSQQPMIEAR